MASKPILPGQLCPRPTSTPPVIAPIGATPIGAAPILSQAAGVPSLSGAVFPGRALSTPPVIAPSAGIQAAGLPLRPAVGVSPGLNCLPPAGAPVGLPLNAGWRGPLPLPATSLGPAVSSPLAHLGPVGPIAPQFPISPQFPIGARAELPILQPYFQLALPPSLPPALPFEDNSCAPDFCSDLPECFPCPEEADNEPKQKLILGGLLVKKVVDDNENPCSDSPFYYLGRVRRCGIRRAGPHIYMY